MRWSGGQRNAPAGAVELLGRGLGKGLGHWRVLGLILVGHTVAAVAALAWGGVASVSVVGGIVFCASNPPGRIAYWPAVPAAIKDEFSDLPISRQRKYQLRMQRDGRCPICGERSIRGVFCLEHWVQHRERVRRKLGCKRRSQNAASYQFEAKAKAAARRKRSKRAK